MNRAIWLIGLIVLMDVFALKVAKDKFTEAKKEILTNELADPEVKDEIPADTVEQAVEVKFIGASKVTVRGDTVGVNSSGLAEHLRDYDSVQLKLGPGQRGYLDLISRARGKGMKILIPVDSGSEGESR
jgi:hypothetical protein